MKEIMINRDSWHYWFANLGDGANTSDFCAYVRSVLGGILMCIFGIVIISLYSGITGLAVGWLFAVINNGWVDPEAAAPGLAINGAIIIALALVPSYRAIRQTSEKSEFIQHAYVSLKDKICFKVR